MLGTRFRKKLPAIRFKVLKIEKIKKNKYADMQIWYKYRKKKPLKIDFDKFCDFNNTYLLIPGKNVP